jgi:hypothetical protein
MTKENGARRKKRKANEKGKCRTKERKVEQGKRPRETQTGLWCCRRATDRPDRKIRWDQNAEPRSVKLHYCGFRNEWLIDTADQPGR